VTLTTVVSKEFGSAFKACGQDFWRVRAPQSYPYIRVSLPFLSIPVNFQDQFKRHFMMNKTPEQAAYGLRARTIQTQETLEDFVFSFNV